MDSPAPAQLGRLVLLPWAVLAAGVLALYWHGIQSLFQAWERPEYSHGYLVPFVAAVIAIKRYEPAARKHGDSWIGFLVTFLAVILGVFGLAAGINDIITYGLLAAILGLSIIALGLQPVRRMWPAYAYLIFMLPLPNFIYWPLSIKLQFLSSEIGVVLINLMNIPVYLEGNIIDLGNYQLQVAEACSGLRYLFPLASFGFLFATLYRGPVWHKIVLFLASFPITILTNSARIAIIGLLVHLYGIAQAEGFLHAFEGWVIFVICIVLLLGLAMLLQKFFGAGKAVSETLDFDLRGLAPKLASCFKLNFGFGLAAAALLVITAAVASPLVFKHVSRYPARTALQEFPMELSGWQGRFEPLNYDIERVLAADDYLQADYKLADGTNPLPVNLLISYYKSQTEGSGIHSPEVCIPAGGWEVAKWEQTEVNAGPTFKVRVNRAIIEKEKSQQLVYYWFEQRGRRLTNDYVVKAYTVMDSIVTGRSDGALIRVVTPIDADGIKGADERLQKFLAVASAQFPAYVPP